MCYLILAVILSEWEQQLCIMISKAFCIGLKNWIYPVVAPRDKQQVSGAAPASSV